MKERNVFEILSVLERNNRSMTSSEIKSELDDLGIPLTDRMVRHYLQDFDKKGFTENVGKKGRRITDVGRDELKTGYVYARTDFIFDKIIRMVTETKFDVYRQRGEVIVNLSLIDEKHARRVRGVLEELCSSRLFPQLVKISLSGERLCNRKVPEGMFGLATLSSVTIDQILFNNGIYENPMYGCLIKMKDLKPIRCTNFVSPFGCSFDPIELFLSNRIGTVCNAVVKNEGEVLAEHLETPYTARTKSILLLRSVVDIFGGTIMVGRPEGSVLGIPTRQGYTGIVVICGESLPAALEEKGITTNTETVASAINFKELEPIAPVRGEVLLL